MGSVPAIVAAGASALLVFIFFLLDLRNRQLYHVCVSAPNIDPFRHPTLTPAQR
jgi:hypothetical protein